EVVGVVEGPPRGVVSSSRTDGRKCGLIVIAATTAAAYRVGMTPQSTPYLATKRVAFVVMPGSHSLELSGPHDVFAIANTLVGHEGSSRPYEVEVVSVTAGAIQTLGGLRVVPDHELRAVSRGGFEKHIDTLIVVAGQSAATDEPPRELVRWLRRVGPRVRRVGSVCTGAFVLAHAGLLDGKKATTHWAFGEELARRFPRVEVVADRI